jgi:two-component system cell cycle sensor histidine kinase/response regulator CckA
VCASAGTQAEVQLDLIPALPAVRADGSQLEQVLLNLAVNARDAMPDGGVLRFRTSVVDLRDADPRLDQRVSPGRFVELGVSDTGTGMNARVAERAWEPFFTTKELGHGTGLGLATVYGIIRDAGGVVGIDTAEGQGTTFRLYLPVADEPAPDAVPGGPPRRPAGRGHGEVILVVDDEPAMLHVTSRILRRNGYATLEAGGSDEALELASSHGCQLLLTDSVMPGMSGAALADRVLHLVPGVRVLHMSGYTPDTPDFRTAVAGEAFIQKPFTAEALLETVAKALGSRSGC